MGLLSVPLIHDYRCNTIGSWWSVLMIVPLMPWFKACRHISWRIGGQSIHMPRPVLIESITNDLNLPSGSKTKLTPSQGILHADHKGAPWQEAWNYRTLIGKLNFLDQQTCPDISYMAHQCAQYSNSLAWTCCRMYCWLSIGYIQ
jgi:hypothetical protein